MPPETAESTFSASSVTSPTPPKKKRRPTKMSANSEIGTSEEKQPEAQWPPENEHHFVDLILDEVLMGKCIGGELTADQWLEIQTKMTERCPNYPAYDIAQLISKLQSLKAQWNRFHTMVLAYPPKLKDRFVRDEKTGMIMERVFKKTRFSWDAKTGMITGSDEVWRRWLRRHAKDKDMKTNVCMHYEELTTIFHGALATGENAISSNQARDIQPLPNRRQKRKDYSTSNTGMHSRTEMNNRAVKQQCPKLTDVIECQILSDRQKALSQLEQMEYVTENIIYVGYHKLHDPVCCEMFLGIESEEQRMLLLERWVEECTPTD
ncbi:P-loop containing nucleoside triphosphatehydrolases superfamily protein [Striga asiatica]|uniref:P-loop containing nucleoside triphosphatehydrolases superfamily protein n=1 Tax=Striga asiatica TaxID=4170 RepID=A0A5A7PW64_STRAF|nr:P-loop containing nucleoside triphosphatehydrolases superfamily protein [Striga asiatica]